MMDSLSQDIRPHISVLSDVTLSVFTKKSFVLITPKYEMYVVVVFKPIEDSCDFIIQIYLFLDD